VISEKSFEKQMKEGELRIIRYLWSKLK